MLGRESSLGMSQPGSSGTGGASHNPKRAKFDHLESDIDTLLSENQPYDLICVGFGPASLAIAITLKERQDSNPNVTLQPQKPRILFLEKQESFSWHAGMLLPSTKMQISFIKDLVTLRNPTSYFTFLNYLKLHNRLVQFSNLGTFLPSRLELEDYMRWVSGHFADQVKYGQEVLSIRPSKTPGHDKVTGFEIVFTQTSSATGGKPAIPEIYPFPHDKILHSSQYAHQIHRALKVKDKGYYIAVIGNGQSAAEIFDDLASRYPNANIRLITRDSALRRSDDSPFVNEVFDPSAIDRFYQKPNTARVEDLQRDGSTDYSVVRMELLEKIYAELYQQGIAEPNASHQRRRILFLREVIEAKNMPSNQRINLTLRNLNATAARSKEVLAFDAVILATGYVRDAHTELLKECQTLNPLHSKEQEMNRDYSVNLDSEWVEDDVGIWLQGCNEATHGLSDTLLSVLATRSGELVQSIFGPKKA